MAMAFFGHSHFAPMEKESDLMDIMVGPMVEYHEIHDFYFTGDNSFISYAHEFCKRYREEDPTARLIYVASDEDTEATLKEKERQFDLVIRPYTNKPKPTGISTAEQYMVDVCEFVTIYHEGGADLGHLWYHARLRKKDLLDYYTERNMTCYFMDGYLALEDKEIENFTNGAWDPFEFAQHIALYLHIHKELLKDEKFYTLYQASIFYLVEASNLRRNVIFYEYKDSKKFVVDELDALAQDAVMQKQKLMPHDLVENFCRYYDRVIHREVPPEMKERLLSILQN